MKARPTHRPPALHGDCRWSLLPKACHQLRQIMGISGRKMKTGWIAQRTQRGVAWILAAKLPRLRPTVWHSSASLFLAPALLSLNDGRVNHAVFVVCILCKHFKNTQPDVSSASARVAQMHHAEVAKAVR